MGHEDFEDYPDGIDQIKTAALELGLQFDPCGLNADWYSHAWHLGPGSTPNQVNGDYYISDGEDGSYYLCKYFCDNEDEDSIVELESSYYENPFPIIEKLKKLFTNDRKV